MMIYHNLSGDISPEKGLAANINVTFYSGGQPAFKVGHGLKLDQQTNTLSVDTADAVEKDNTLPITSAAVYTTVGNIEALLNTI